VDTSQKRTLKTLLSEKIKTNQIRPDATAIIQPTCYENNIKDYGETPYGKNGLKGYTYSEVQEMVLRVAHVIKKIINTVPWEPTNADGDLIIAICLPNTLQLIVTVLAILELECCYLAIDAMCAEEQLIHILRDNKPLLIIIEPDAPVLSRYKFISASSSSKAPRVIPIDLIWKDAMSLKGDVFADSTPLLKQNPEDIITAICYTSGTGALPKPVRISHQSIFNRLVWQWKTFPYQSDDRAALTARPTSVAFIPELFAPLLAGVPVFILHRFSKPKAEALINAIYFTKLTHITVSPLLLNSIVDMVDKDANPDKMRLRNDKS